MSGAVRGEPVSHVFSADIDAVLEEFHDDPREAIRALLGDIDALARDHVATVSAGYVRGEVFPAGLQWRGRRS